MENLGKSATSAEIVVLRGQGDVTAGHIQSHSGQEYRPEIDGLRAIAVFAVVLFHIDTPGFSGGFVGVDIFFVISGYLITAILCRDIAGNRFKLSHFYERRARRILPALFATMLATLAIGSFVYDPVTMSELGKSVAATSFFCSNLYFWTNTGYFGAPKSEIPLLHTWSLAVEEQFYLLWPFFVLLTFRLSKGLAAFLMATVFVASFALSAYGALHHPAATFFMAPTRAWEMMLGAVLAMPIFRVRSLTSETWRIVIRVMGLALIVGSITMYTKNTAFPGMAALAPALGTALIVYAGGHGSDPIIKLLRSRPAIYVGAISYSLYLWHWPIVSLMGYLSLPSLTWSSSTRLVALFSFFVLAHASWRYIETPFRCCFSWAGSKRRLILAATATTFMFIAGYYAPYIAQCLFPSRLTTAGAILAANESRIRQKDSKYKSDVNSMSRSGALPRFGDPKAAPTLALVGDSHANALMPALHLNAMRAGVSGIAIVRDGTPPLLGVKLSDERKGYDIHAHNDLALKVALEDFGVKTVILASRWRQYIHGHWRERGEGTWMPSLQDTLSSDDNGNPMGGKAARGNASILQLGLKRTIERVASFGSRAVLVYDVPELGVNAVRLFHLSELYPAFYERSRLLPSLDHLQGRTLEMDAILRTLSELPGVNLIRPDRHLFDGRGKVLLVYEDNFFSATITT